MTIETTRMTNLVLDLATILRGQEDPSGLMDEASPLIKELTLSEDLAEFCTDRPSGRTYKDPAAQAVKGFWLYYDPLFSITVVSYPLPMHNRLHDHGSWEITGLLSGEIDYRSCRLKNEGTEEETVENVVERKMQRGNSHSWDPRQRTFTVGMSLRPTPGSLGSMGRA